MPLARWQGTIVDVAGNIVAGAQITVRREVGGAPLAPLFVDRDGVTPLGNPFTADPTGFAAFHVAGGAYRIEAVNGGFTRTWRYVGIGTNSETDAETLTDVIATGSTEPRQLADRFADVINVLDFEGADPTGVNDSTAAFQAAAAAYAASNRAFWCPDGLYLISEQIAFELPSAVLARNEPPPSLRFGANAHLRATATIAGGLVRWGSGGGGTSYGGLIENGEASGGLFDCNDFADVGFDVPFCNNVLLRAMQARNHKLYGFRAGNAGSPNRSYGALFENCQTERYGIHVGITAITNANPGAVTLASAHDLTTGDKVTIDGVGGMTQVNNLTYTITVTGANTFTLGVNTTGLGAYTSGGNAYSGFAPTGSVGIYYENCGDSHATNCTLTGNQIGISSDDGIYDGKFVSNHVWNFLFNGELLYGYDMAGDNQLLGCQCDGPFKYAFRFTNVRNQLIACQTTYEDETYGGQDNYAYAIRTETGAGSTAIGCSWKAMSGFARLAGELEGDGAAFISYGNRAQNMAAEPFGEFHRRDLNADLNFIRQNSHAGASAAVANRLTTNAGTLFEVARSIGGGAGAIVDWTGSGGFFLSSGNVGGVIDLQTNYTTRFRVGASGNIYCPGAGTTAGGGQTAKLNSGSSPANELLRDTSSARYKRDVEPMDLNRAKALLALEPVWYRSKSQNDRQDWSWYGFLAEDLAAIEPRFVAWGYRDEDVEEIEVDVPHRPGIKAKVQRVRDGAELVPDGIAYDRLVVAFFALLKEQEQRISALETKLTQRA